MSRGKSLQKRKPSLENAIEMSKKRNTGEG